MNIDQLTAKFAQAYVKRSEETYNGQPIAELSPEEMTAAVQRALNARAYIDRSNANRSTGGLFRTAGQPWQRQSGETGTMSENPQLPARPIETRQSFGSGSFFDPFNPGFWSIDIPFDGDQSGWGTGGAGLNSLLTYGATKGLLNRGLLYPSSYSPGLSRSPVNMTPQAVANFYSRSLEADPQVLNSDLGKRNFPLTAMQQGRPLAKSETMNPEALIEAMKTNRVPGPGVDLPRGLNRSVYGPVSIVATHAAPKGGGKGGDKGARRLQTKAVLSPYTSLVSPRGLPTAQGLRRALLPSSPFLGGGVPTGSRGSFRGGAPLYAAAAGFISPFLFNAYNAATGPQDPNGGPLSGFSPSWGYNPAVLGAKEGFFGDTPMIYENVPGKDILYGQGN